ncbi:TAXI family TRAP transporter solute-binding subunit [Candidatus Sumerlaeota bacterium]|nr:TAXI family TRAP transporter solute-binding subunit [Candidatus Sumerlaeota bacterium]
MVKRISHHLLIIGMIFLLFSSYAENPDDKSGKKTYILCTGNRGGQYYHIGMALRDILEDTDIHLQVKETAGSVQNIEMVLYDPEQDHLGIAQANDVYSCLSDPTFASKISYIRELYDERLFIFVRKNLGIRNVEDLAGRKVNIGEDKSGTANCAKKVLGYAGVFNKITPYDYNFPSSGEKLISGELDAAFYMISPDSPFLKALLESPGIEQINPDRNILLYFDNQKGYSSFQTGDERGIRITSVLICPASMPMKDVGIISRAIEEHLADIKIQTGALLVQPTGFGSDFIRRHPGYAYRKSVKRLISQFSQVALVAGFLILLIYFYRFTYKNRLLKRLSLIFFVRVFLVMAAIVVSGSTLLYLIEHNFNEYFRTLFDSHWSMIVYILSGFEDVKTETVAGKIISAMMVLSGILFVAILTGERASTFTFQKLKGGKKMNLKDHFIICNWNPRGDKIVRELHNEIAKPDSQIVVITESLVDDGIYSKIPEYENVVFVASNLYSKNTYDAFRIQDASSVIILVDEDHPDPDAKTALITMAIRQVVGDTKLWKGNLIAESVNHQKVELLKGAGVDEVICPGDYGTAVLAQAALFKKISDVYHDLLTYSRDSNEVYIIDYGDIPEGVWKRAFEGKTFEQASKKISEMTPDENPYILIGIRRNDVCIVNPRKNERLPGKFFDIFREKDSPIFLAYEKPDLRKLKSQNAPA